MVGVLASRLTEWASQLRAAPSIKLASPRNFAAGGRGVVRRLPIRVAGRGVAEVCFRGSLPGDGLVFLGRFMVAFAIPDDVAGDAELRRSCVREGIVLLKSGRSRSSLRAEILDKVTVDAIVF